MWREGNHHMGHSFDICLIEMWAVLLELRLINRAPVSLLHDHDMLYLFVDNEPVVLWIAGKQKMQHLYVRDVLLQVYTEIHRLFERAAIRCTIQWTRRGIWAGNNRADEQVKTATKQTHHRPHIGYLPTSHGATKTERARGHLVQKRSCI